MCVETPTYLIKRKLRTPFWISKLNLSEDNMQTYVHVLNILYVCTDSSICFNSTVRMKGEKHKRENVQQM